MSDPQVPNPYGSPEASPSSRAGQPGSPVTPQGGYPTGPGSSTGWPVTQDHVSQPLPQPFDRAPEYDGGPFASTAAPGWSLPPGTGLPPSMPCAAGAMFPTQPVAWHEEVARVRRGVTWRIVVASVFWGLAGLMLLASISAVAQENFSGANGAYVFGYLLGIVLIVGVPVAVALPFTISVLRRRKRIRALEANYSGWTPMSP